MARLFFAFRKYFCKKPADHAPIALRNNACRNQNNFLYQMRRRPRHWHRHFNRFLLSLGKYAGPRCHALLIRASALMFPTTSTKRWRSHPCQLTHGRADTETFRCQVDRFTITATNACLRLAVGTAVGLLGVRNPVDNTHEQMQPVGSAVRPFRRSHSCRNLFYLVAGFL
jgi:hypothetical protein